MRLQIVYNMYKEEMALNCWYALKPNQTKS